MLRSLASGVRRHGLRASPSSLARQSLQRPSRGLATLIEPDQKDPAELDQITTLPNGIRVATEALPGHFSGVGVYLDAGSRYEDSGLRGVSHIIDRLAFKVSAAVGDPLSEIRSRRSSGSPDRSPSPQSTSSRTSDQMLEALESLGGNIQCASSRESLMYQSATFNSAVSTTLALLAETIRDPLITEEEVQQQLETAEYEIGEIWSKPELILPELVHMAAYKDNTLGNPLLCPKERLGEIDKAVIERYRDTFFTPERMVVAFAGVDHDEATELTRRYFGDMSKGHRGAVFSGVGSDSAFTDSASSESVMSEAASSRSTSSSASPVSSPSTSPAQSSNLLSKIPFFKNISTSASHHASVSPIIPSNPHSSPLDLAAPSRYTGGFLSLPPLPPPANLALPRLSHIHLAFEALPISSPDIYALATLQTLLGGGGSFSAGGPGKGMYSRLYTNVLNQHGWVESCVAFNHSYTDSGLFGISASCSPAKVSQMLEVMCRELQALTLDTGFSSLQTAEVERAKNQLRSSLLMNLESRMVELEDLGRQVQVHGRKVGVKEMCRKIDELTVPDLRRVARLVMAGLVSNAGAGSGAPTVVLQEGEEEGLNRKDLRWDDIQERISLWKLGRRWPLVLRFIKGAIHVAIFVPVVLHALFTVLVVYLDQYVNPNLGLPSSIIPSLSIVVGLMLVFRNQTSYERFWTGRNYFTQICTSVRNLTRSFLCCSYNSTGTQPTPSERADTERAVRILIAILYSIKNHLRAEWGAVTPPGISSDGDPAIKSEFAELLPKGLKVYEEHGLGLPLELTFFVERYIKKATDRGWFNAPQASQMQVQLNTLVDAYGRMETIRLTPLPVAHLIHQRQVLALFCCILPFAMVGNADDLGWWAIPIVTLISFTLYGIEGIGSQLEDPFGYDRNDIKMDAIVEDSRQEIMVTLDEWRRLGGSAGPGGGEMFSVDEGARFFHS
ncbi:MAG: Mitochondrial-processing peptidase subunit alpha [Thelocarpon impressellum]|nr:MAG: Mitochondrial-processing peptidase subunit alpha [Thelocarpon impressellum]